MAQYKVPQDVEADDKLLGPFSFRQFVYLLIAGGLIAAAVGLFQLFPLLALIPLPPVLLFGALALPLKKDQPMETYLAAVASYYLKPHTRKWLPGQKDVAIEITAPKIVDDSRARELTGEEATHRLSFLADIVDTEGYAIKGMGMNHANTELAAEAVQTRDMFETNNFNNLATTIVRDENERHAEVIKEMQEEIERNENMVMGVAPVEEKKPSAPMARAVVAGGDAGVGTDAVSKGPNFKSAAVVTPGAPVEKKPVEKSNQVRQKHEEKAETKPTNPSIMELANNADYSVATIAKEANRIKEREKGEVFIALH